MQIIAHRGASHDAPENTLAAVELAWEQLADAVEVDVHLTIDGELIVCHDSNTHRTTGVRKVIADQTLADLQKLGPLPSLAEVVASLPFNKRLFVEIKCGTEAIPALQEVIENSGKNPDQFVLIGFDYATMRETRRALPDSEVCWLATIGADSMTIDALIAKAQAIGVDGLDLEASSAIDSDLVRKVHQSGLKLYVWTVDDIELARHLTHARVDGITTNRPGWLREQLNG